MQEDGEFVQGYQALNLEPADTWIIKYTFQKECCLTIVFYDHIYIYISYLKHSLSEVQGNL